MSKNEIFADEAVRANNGTTFKNITGTDVSTKRGLDVVAGGLQPDGDWTVPKADGTAFQTETNLGGTRLDGDLNSSVTTITVDSTTDFPDSGTLGIDTELISYTGKTSTTFTGCTRGSFQTTAQAHIDNEPVGEAFISGWTDTDGWDSVEVFVQSLQVSKDLGLFIQFTEDAQAVTPEVRAQQRYSYDEDDIARGYEDIRFAAVLDGFRVIYVNGAGTQTDFFLHANLRVSGDVARYNKGGALITGNFETEVALGTVSNYEVNTKFGRVKGIDNNDSAVDIWSFADDGLATRSNTKTFPSSASIFYFASSSSSDTTVTLSVSYVDGLGIDRSETVSLNGQTPVALSIAALDINRMFVNGSTSAVGNIYALSANNFTAGGLPNNVAQVVATIQIGYGQTQQTQFTVPTNKRMIIKSYKILVSRGSGLAGSSDVTLRVKPFGLAPRVLREFFPTTGSPVDKENANIVVEARSQVVWRLDDVSDNDTNVACIWDYVLVDD